MEYKIYSENKDLCLTPEHKLEKWQKIIQDAAKDGNTVILYADTETTGLEYGNRGRGIYDPLLDRRRLQADSISFGVPLSDLENEARELAGKVDVITEIAVVFCTKNKNGEVRPLRDDEGELIYFHEFISPYRDRDIAPSDMMQSMPIVPGLIHKTSFEFLKGEEVHPFLNVQLPHEAPSTRKTLETMFKFFEYDDPEIFNNIVMLFHNGNGFDIPFIDAEISRIGDDYANKTLRDYVKVYDSLDIVKTMLPNPVQKLVSFNQTDPIYGGIESLKDDKDVYITGHHKNLDNLIRFARYVPNFDLGKAVKYQSEENQSQLMKIKSAMIKAHEKPTEELMTALENNSIDIDFIDSLSDEFKKANKSMLDGYKKFVSAVAAYEKNVDEVTQEYPEIMKNLNNISDRIARSPDFKENIEMINSIGRDAHGAKVDSMLFMYAMTIIENSMYISNKITYTLEDKEPTPIDKNVFESLKAHLASQEKLENPNISGLASDLEKITKKHGMESGPVAEEKPETPERIKQPIRGIN